VLNEVPASQSPQGRRRRWFSDDDFDLVVWFSDSGAIVEFELCYDKPRVERALVWSHVDGYAHFRVDTGEATPLKNLAPMLIGDGPLAKDEVIPRFLEASARLDPAIRRFILARLQEFSEDTHVQ